MSNRKRDRDGDTGVTEPIRQVPAEAETGAPEEPQNRPGAIPDEQALFGGDSGPRIFGEGSYGTGGSTNEGNYEERATNPHGHYGSFDDAGGYGGTELLGERAGGEERSRRRAAEARADERKPGDSSSAAKPSGTD